jgi:hypothetical protein
VISEQASPPPTPMAKHLAEKKGVHRHLILSYPLAHYNKPTKQCEILAFVECKCPALFAAREECALALNFRATAKVEALGEKTRLVHRASLSGELERAISQKCVSRRIGYESADTSRLIPGFPGLRYLPSLFITPPQSFPLTLSLSLSPSSPTRSLCLHGRRGKILFAHPIRQRADVSSYSLPNPHCLEINISLKVL